MNAGYHQKYTMHHSYNKKTKRVNKSITEDVFINEHVIINVLKMVTRIKPDSNTSWILLQKSIISFCV